MLCYPIHHLLVECHCTDLLFVPCFFFYLLLDVFLLFLALRCLPLCNLTAPIDPHISQYHPPLQLTMSALYVRLLPVAKEKGVGYVILVSYFQ